MTEAPAGPGHEVELGRGEARLVRVVLGGVSVLALGHLALGAVPHWRSTTRLWARSGSARPLDVPTIVTSGVSVSHPFLPTDIVVFTLMVGGALALAVLTSRAFDPTRLAMRPTAAPLNVA